MYILYILYVFDDLIFILFSVIIVTNEYFKKINRSQSLYDKTIASVDSILFIFYT